MTILSKLGSCIGKILLIYFLLVFPIEASSTKIEDGRKPTYKANVKKVGSDYGLLVSEGGTILQIRVDYSGGSNPIYVGWAEPGANYTDVKWRIVKFGWNGDNLLRMNFADGVSTFTKNWNQRTTYDYEPDN